MDVRRVAGAVVGLALAVSARSADAQIGAPLADAEPEWYLRGEGGCRLFVQEFGRGRDTVVVLHGGWGAEHSYLFDALRGLDTRFHLVFYDQRGSLRSPCADTLVTAERHVADLERLREQLGLRRVTLFGHSNGTRLATLYLARHPDRVRGLVLASPGNAFPRVPAAAADTAAVATQARAMAAFLARPEVDAELRRQGLDGDTARLSDKARTTRWRVRFAGANLYHVERWREVRGGQVFWNRAAAEAAARSMPPTFDLVPALRAHPCPIWLLEGDHDFGPATVAVHRRWIREVPTARLVVLPKAGHNAWTDAPGAWRQAVRAALASAASCRARPRE
jgi:pimeloyl-ACP methyl ester carboxylesterase